VLSHFLCGTVIPESVKGADMTKQPADGQEGGRMPPSTAFNDLKKVIAERNEAAHKEARELRITREREKLGILGRHKVDIDR